MPAASSRTPARIPLAVTIITVSKASEARSVMIARAATTMRRSRRSAVSSPEAAMASANDAVLRQVHMRELTVGIVEVEFDRAGGLVPASADLRQRILEAVGNIDPDT